MAQAETEVILLDIEETADGKTNFSLIDEALSQAKMEALSLDETIESVKALKPDCDKVDYALAASSGALCGLIDVFLVGKPGQSPVGNITDKWFDNRVCDFAKRCGWRGNDKNPVRSAVGFLERKFKVPYDQRGCGDAGSIVYDLTPSNHHFKSLAHNPSICGLFFSILDQFTKSSHFITEDSEGRPRLIEIVDADGTFELRSSNPIGKFFCGFTNWFGHLMSDVAGASGSSSRGKGIPSPLWSWINSVIAIKSKLGLSANDFDKNALELAVKNLKKGFDFRFQTTQVIPVIVNELIVRLCYSVRRLLNYLADKNQENRSLKAIWKACKPYSNPSIKRMLTVAHGVFCLMDIGDATIRSFAVGGGNFNAVEFCLRLNIIGVGRFTISLYGETKRVINYHRANRAASVAQNEKNIVENYIEGLYILKAKYEDKELLTFVDDLANSEYIAAFNKTAALASQRGVTFVLKNKEDINSYFNPSTT